MKKIADFGLLLSLMRLEELEFRKSPNISSSVTARGDLATGDSHYEMRNVGSKVLFEQSNSIVQSTSQDPAQVFVLKLNVLGSCTAASRTENLKIHFEEVTKLHLVSIIWPKLAAFYTQSFSFQTLKKAKYSLFQSKNIIKQWAVARSGIHKVLPQRCNLSKQELVFQNQPVPHGGKPEQQSTSSPYSKFILQDSLQCLSKWHYGEDKEPTQKDE